ncbi:hypothetical protein KAJ61_06085 [Candidatus Parcubacteria bacterium]|nr:hypothetical protein [Candidatus Parcubacteria bacterium]
MRKKFTIFLILIFVLGLVPINFSNAQNLSDRLSGKILLQVECAGQAWYIDPESKERAFLGRPADAFRIMRELGLGISEADYNHFGDVAPSRLSGKILLRVGANGEAYYVNPDDLKMHYLGRPTDAFNIMRNQGLGITNNDLETVPVFQKYKEQPEEDAKAVAVLGEKIQSQNDKIVELEKKLSDIQNTQIPTTTSEPQPILDSNNRQEANDYIDNEIASTNSIISKFFTIKNNNQNFVQDTKNELSEYSYSNLVQSSGQQLINEVENQNFITNQVFDVCNQIITEFNSLKNTGDTTSNNYKFLESQLTNYINQYGIAENKAKALIKTYVSNIADALQQQTDEINKEIERLQKANNALDELKAYINSADVKLNSLLSDLHEIDQKITNIKNQAIPMGIVNAQLIEPTAEYNALINEYNLLIETRSDLARLYNVVTDYAKNNTPISYSDKQILQELGIYL